MSLRILQIAADAKWVGRPFRPMRRYGVPPGGPYDRESFAWCVGLSESNEAIEIGPFGARFRCEADVSVAVTGAERKLMVAGRPVSRGRFGLRAGEVLELGPVVRGARSYLACWNGRSRPELVRDALLDGRPSEASRILALNPPSLAQAEIRVVPGPQADAFDLDVLVQTEWTVDLAADRMGIRLDGPKLTSRVPLGERPSEPQTVGVIQVTVGGTPIVIGPDGPTIGGYPKVAVVVDADLDRLGQLVPNAVVRFVLVDLTTAADLCRAYRSRLRHASAMRA